MNTEFYDRNNNKNIIVTIPIKEKYQSLIAAAIGSNGNNIKSVKNRIINGINPKYIYIYIKGENGNKYWQITISINEPGKWKLLEKSQVILKKNLDFFYKKKISHFSAILIKKNWRKYLDKKH